MNLTNFSNLLYIIKCLIGIIICYWLYKQFPAYPFYWSLVSVAITISPDSSNKLAYDRIIANVLGCTVALSIYPVHAPALVLLCAGVAVTIVAGTLLKLTTVLRTAIAALVIVIITEEEHHRSWMIALERVGCVIAGCAVALAVTLVFNNLIHYYRRRIGDPNVSQAGTGE
jgi:uncharacterized membrane protein YgaE (UPF0421/DUF939 family)